MKIKIINRSNNELPSYATTGSAGMDIRANLSESVTIYPLDRVLIPTGIFIQLPTGYEAQLRPRSGLSHKHGITLSNSPATIDEDYTGECFVSLINLSVDPFVVNNGDRIAQMIINKYEKCDWDIVEELEKTSRGDGGFGHTKIK